MIFFFFSPLLAFIILLTVVPQFALVWDDDFEANLRERFSLRVGSAHFGVSGARFDYARRKWSSDSLRVGVSAVQVGFGNEREVLGTGWVSSIRGKIRSQVHRKVKKLSWHDRSIHQEIQKRILLNRWPEWHQNFPSPWASCDSQRWIIYALFLSYATCGCEPKHNLQFTTSFTSIHSAARYSVRRVRCKSRPKLIFAPCNLFTLFCIWDSFRASPFLRHHVPWA